MENSRRRRTPGVHMQFGLRYQHADLTRGHRNNRNRRLAGLMRIGLTAVQERYSPELDREMMQALHDAIVRLIRPEVVASWTEQQARDRALQIAKNLLEEPLTDC